jgi:hypothetical protein
MLKMWFPDETTWGELHTRIILFGREYCTARKHDMDACAVCSFAATAEARMLNKSSPNKFLAAAKHKDPYSILESATAMIEDTNEDDRDDIDAVDATTAPAKGKAKRVAARKAAGPKSAVVAVSKNDVATTRTAVAEIKVTTVVSGSRKRKANVEKAQAVPSRAELASVKDEPKNGFLRRSTRTSRN